MAYKLTESFCVYLDILGYSKRLEKIRLNELKIELHNYKNFVESENEYLNKLGEIVPFDIKLFSDSIFISWPYEKETINNLHLIFSIIIDYQKSLIERNYFIRGGISKGKLYSSNETIWGPALIEAVKVEKSTIYPFIGISNKVLRLLIKNKLLRDTCEFLSIPMIECFHKKYFLDYLQTCIHINNGKPELYDFPSNHKRFIENNIRNNYEESILNKYVFLAQYHNAFCTANIEVIPQIQRLLIKDSIINDRIFKRKYLKISNDDEN